MSTCGTGEYAPMPPVFGPTSPSPSRLKSCAAPSGTTRRPSESANSETSGPSSSSSMTTPWPSASTAGSAASSSSAVRHTNTPLPAARPSDLTTHGTRATARVSAVGTPAARSTSLANAFDPSIRAASALGPNTAIPLWRRTSATPATSGTSGPMTTRSTSRVSASASRPSPSSARTGWQWPRAAMPGLPGAAWSSVSRVLCASRQASACSRAPEPTTSTFTRRVYSDLCSSLSRRQRCSSGSSFAPRRTLTVRTAVTITGTKIESATMICVQVEGVRASMRPRSRENALACRADPDKLDRQA